MDNIAAYSEYRRFVYCNYRCLVDANETSKHYLNLKTCVFGKSEATYTGNFAGSDKMQMNQESTESLLKLKTLS